MIAEKLPGGDYGAGPIGMDAAQIKGVLPRPLSALRSTLPTVPEASTKSTLKQYRPCDAVTELTEFRDRGHSLTIDSGWRAVAEECLGWLGQQGL